MLHRTLRIVGAPIWFPAMLLYSIAYGWTVGMAGSVTDVFEYLADWNRQEVSYEKKYPFRRGGGVSRDKSRFPLSFFGRFTTIVMVFPLFLMVGLARGFCFGPYRAFQAVQRRSQKWQSRSS